MNVIFTGDTQRPGCDVTKNIKWLSQIQRHRYSDKKIWVFSPEEKMTFDQWVKTYDDMNEPSPVIEHFRNHIEFRNLFVIGFELPDRTIRQLETLHINYINYVIYPIRFYYDLVVGYKSNVPLYYLDHLTDRNFELAANLIKAHYDSATHSEDIPEDCTLIVGQTEADRVLIHNGEIKKFDCSEISEPWLFKPHPDMKRPFSICDIDTNIYELLSHPNIKRVAGINSSVLREAKYFGKEVVMQGKDWAKEYHPISASVFLGEEVPPNTLRNSCNAWWGYKTMERT